jgi:hypothetical protein
MNQPLGFRSGFGLQAGLVQRPTLLSYVSLHHFFINLSDCLGKTPIYHEAIAKRIKSSFTLDIKKYLSSHS